MLRKLLACLALLTGLAAAGAPAQAEVAAVAAQMEAMASQGTAKRGQAVAPSTRRAAPSKLPRAASAGPVLKTIWRVPTVELGSDRARE